ncbi:MAG TPA: LLM class flavin-dependent oxidoreductase [Acidimicrobiales bacterium]|nr:LLM class flavin-dependent oxidoreductase [Acidimicrobiales bacterium]
MSGIEVGVGPAGVPQVARAGHGPAFIEFIRRVEALGYRSICFGDHLDTRCGPFSALATAAAVTSRLTVAVHVMSVALRNPAVVAQELRSIQVLSDGRVEIGLGLGWLHRDFADAGVAMTSFDERLDRLDTTVATIRESFRAGAVPTPTIVIGGGGPKMLATAARLADIVTINIPLAAGGGLAGNTVASGTRELVVERLRIARSSAHAAGRNVRLHLYVHEVHVGADWREVAEGRASTLGMTVDDYLDSPHVLVGDNARIASVLEQRREELGISYVSIPGTALDAFAAVL